MRKDLTLSTWFQFHQVRARIHIIQTKLAYYFLILQMKFLNLAIGLEFVFATLFYLLILTNLSFTTKTMGIETLKSVYSPNTAQVFLYFLDSIAVPICMHRYWFSQCIVFLDIRRQLSTQGINLVSDMTITNIVKPKTYYCHIGTKV